MEPSCSTGTILPHLAVLYRDGDSQEAVHDDIHRPLSVAEILAIEVLLGDSLAAAALTDYLQESGIDVSQTDRILADMTADEEWTKYNGVKVFRPHSDFLEEIERRRRLLK